MRRSSTMWRPWAMLPVVAALLSWSLRARADEAARSTPRGAVAQLLELARQERYAEAAGTLDLSGVDPRDGPRLARELAAVLERQEWLSIDAVSGSPEGDLEDGLAAESEEIGRIQNRLGGSDAVRLRRVGEGENRLWVFGPATVALVDGWYRELPHRWLLDRIPEPLLRRGPAGLRYWQWLAFPLLALLAAGIGMAAARLTQILLGRLVQRTATRWDDIALARLRGPMRLAWSLGAAFALLPVLDLVGGAHLFVTRGLRTALFLVFFWALLRTIDILSQIVALSPWVVERPSSRSLVALSARIVKVVVVAMAAVAALAEFGFPVASLVAGLGIGGLALALAAQKTVENLFGAVSLGVDQPFREGDFVRIEDFVGTVEAIGLRSTRIRTLDRTLIALPNGRLADMRVESFSARDRMRLACTVGLVYGATVAQMREVLAGLESVLRAHPKIWPDAVVVRFKELGDHALNIEVMAWFMTPDWGEFQAIRQEVLLKFMEVIERAGTSFAFPTRTVHVVAETAADVPRLNAREQLAAKPATIA